MSEPAVQHTMINGVDVDQFEETRESLKGDPELAKCQFRLKNRWYGGGHSRSTIESFYGARQDIDHESPFVLDGDEPPILLGKDLGPNPVEHLLNAITMCVTTAIVYHAAAKGIQIDDLRSEVEGHLDLRGFMALDPNVRPGYQSIRMKFLIKSDASEEEIQELVKAGQKYSPVYNSVTQGVPVEVVGERM